MSSSHAPELRPFLVERAIRWLPADDHAAMPAVQAGATTAVEPLVIQRDVLLEIETHVRIARARAFGILVGAIYRCPHMRLDYLLVERVVRGEGPAGTREADEARRDALSELIEGVEHRGLHAVGWYRGGATIYPRIGPRDIVMHADLFPAAWSVALLREGPGTRAGACMRLSPEPRRPYLAQFHELLPAEPHQGGEPLGTALAWSNYRTDAEVELVPELARVTTPGPFIGVPPHLPPPAPSAPPRDAGQRQGPFVPPPRLGDDEPAGPAAQEPAGIAPEPEPHVRPAPSPVDVLFDAPPAEPHDDAGAGAPPRRPPKVTRRQVRHLVVLLLATAAIASTLLATRLVDRLRGVDDVARFDDAADSDSAAAPAVEPPSPAAAFAVKRLGESVSNLNADLARIDAALDTSGTGALPPNGCAAADSAYTRTVLDRDAITLAQRYLDRPLDPALRQRIDALTSLADTAGLRIRRACTSAAR